MDATIASNNTMRQKNIADLLPELTRLLAEDTLTAKKQPRNTTAVTAPRTTEKFKPLTMAEMRAEIEAINGKSTKKSTSSQVTTSTMKKRWNSSIKVDKKFVSHTGEGQKKNNPVRKVLYFSNTQQATTSKTRATIVNTETPKFPKPESRAKKSLHQFRAKDNIRISGVYNITETPVESKKPIKSRVTIANKENIINPRISYHTIIPSYSQVTRKLIPPAKPVSIRKTILPRVPDTPLSNDSWKSSCDASFLQQEKEIQDVEDRVEALLEQQTLENIAEVSPPVSTPFKEYRNVQEYFNNSSDMENSVNDNTIMCFDKPSVCIDKEKSKREESAIVSLCDLFNKATVTNNDNSKKSELEILIEIKKETENNIKSQLKLLKYVNKLIKKKSDGEIISFSDKTQVEDAPKIMITEVKNEPEKSQIRRVSVIKSPVKSPSYIIPKKTPCLRKKVFHKSMPEVSNCQTPKTNIDTSNRALTMYMRMKEKMNFLNTPLVKQKPTTFVPDTPTMTSHNLQVQLDKLFNNS